MAPVAWFLLNINTESVDAQESGYDFFASISMVNPDEGNCPPALQFSVRIGWQTPMWCTLLIHLFGETIYEHQQTENPG
jgi:hypothetical protein